MRMNHTEDDDLEALTVVVFVYHRRKSLPQKKSVSAACVVCAHCAGPAQR